MAAVEFAQAHQPAQDVREVAAEDAPVGVDFIDHNIPEVLKQLYPLGMVRQDAGMQHVRIGYHDMPRLADGFPRSCRCVPVVGVGLDVDPHLLDHVVQLADLVGGKRLGREQVQRPGIRILQDGGQNRQVVAHGFAGSRRRNDRHIFPAGDCLQAFRLVGVQLMDSAAGKRRLQPLIHRGRERHGPGFAGRDHLPPGYILHEHIVPPELVSQLRYVHPPASFYPCVFFHYKIMPRAMQGEQNFLFRFPRVLWYTDFRYETCCRHPGETHSVNGGKKT